MDALLTPLIPSLYGAVQILALAMGRPIGMMLAFTAFSWGGISSGVLRGVLAAALALPVATALGHDGFRPTEIGSATTIILVVKEVGLGVLIGFVCALPLEAIGAAGCVADAYNGGSSITSPTGETTPLGQLYMVVALFMFASLGGFWRLTEGLYATYTFWPLEQLVPSFSADAGSALVTLVSAMFVTAATLAGPFLLTFLFIDVALLVAARMGKQLNPMFLAPAARMIALALILPLMAALIVRVASAHLGAALDPTPYLELLAKGKQ